MHEISPLAWLVIGCMGFFIVGINLVLILFLMRKPGKQAKIAPSQDDLQVDRLIEVIKDPFSAENRQINRLSGLVNSLQKGAAKEKEEHK